MMELKIEKIEKIISENMVRDYANVSGDFNTVSVYCYYHGYMGGQNIFTYSSS